MLSFFLGVLQETQRRRRAAEGSFLRSFGYVERYTQRPVRENLEKQALPLDRAVTNFQDLMDDIANDYKEMKLRIKTANKIQFAQGPTAVRVV